MRHAREANGSHAVAAPELGGGGDDEHEQQPAPEAIFAHAAHLMRARIRSCGLWSSRSTAGRRSSSSGSSPTPRPGTASCSSTSRRSASTTATSTSARARVRTCPSRRTWRGGGRRCRRRGRGGRVAVCHRRSRRVEQRLRLVRGARGGGRGRGGRAARADLVRAGRGGALAGLHRALPGGQHLPDRRGRLGHRPRCGRRRRAAAHADRQAARRARHRDDLER